MMRRMTWIFVAGLAAIASAQLLWALLGAAQSRAAEDAGPTNESRDADIAMLKGRMPDQAHAMTSVAYHFNNLWFAAEAENWPLAEFYWNETRSHLRWSVRIIPIRKDNAGREVKLPDILQAIENTTLTQLKEHIDAKDGKKFEATYKQMLESCYSCHKAADKPYLRPRVPQQPAEPMMNFDPKATWPQ
jgi:hypothetical protein